MSPPRKKKTVLPSEPVQPTIQVAQREIEQRLYETMEMGEAKIIVGPHEGLVDTLGLTPAAATRLHNILYRRKIYNYAQAAKHPQEVAGAIQELYSLDAQKLMEAFYNFEKETTEGE
jgi:hypothetical protein